MNRLRSPTIVAALLLAGCATVQPITGHPGAIAMMEDYYQNNAWEDGARCVLPQMDVTETKVLENTPDRLVVEARYFWKDDRAETDTQANTCQGFDTRTFTLSQGQVVAMSGEKRRSSFE